MSEQFALEPFSALVGFQIDEVKKDFCRMRLPFRPELRTNADIFCGGAIASLIDTAGVVAVWSDVSPDVTRGATASMTVNYLSGAERVDLLAEARAIRRGRRVVFFWVVGSSP